MKFLWGLLIAFIFNDAHACLYSTKILRVECKKPFSITKKLIEPTFIAYRLAVQGSTERKCRFEPTCSKFLIEAIKYHGPTKGVLYGFARAQLRHDDNYGTFPNISNGMGSVFYLDPVQNWE